MKCSEKERGGGGERGSPPWTRAAVLEEGEGAEPITAVAVLGTGQSEGT